MDLFPKDRLRLSDALPLPVSGPGIPVDIQRDIRHVEVARKDAILCAGLLVLKLVCVFVGEVWRDNQWVVKDAHVDDNKSRWQAGDLLEARTNDGLLPRKLLNSKIGVRVVRLIGCPTEDIDILVRRRPTVRGANHARADLVPAKHEVPGRVPEWAGRSVGVEAVDV